MWGVLAIARRYYWGSFGTVSGYGPMCASFQTAEASVAAHHRRQRLRGGISDRNVGVVDAETGLMFWLNADPEDDWDERDFTPMRTPDGSQANYDPKSIAIFERNLFGPRELAGFG